MPACRRSRAAGPGVAGPDPVTTLDVVLLGLGWEPAIDSGGPLPKSTGRRESVELIEPPAGAFRIDSLIEHW